MVCLKNFKIYSNTCLKFIYFDVYNYTNIELMCNLFIKVKISYLNIKAIKKKLFKLAYLLL